MKTNNQIENLEPTLKKKILPYLTTTIVGIVITGLILLYKEVFTLKTSKEVFQALTDGFFVSGVLIFGFGLLVFASNEGTFDMISYGFSKLFNSFRKDMTKMKHKTFYDYRSARLENKLGFGHLILVGLIFIILSFVFLSLYHQV